MLTDQQKDAVVTLLEKAARDVIMHYYDQLKDEHVAYKNGDKNDLQTIGDIEAERVIREGLVDILPGSLFVGEESYNDDSSLLRHLRKRDVSVWVLDPIDGTSNFRYKRGGFGPLLAHVVNGVVHNAWMLELPAGKLITYHRDETLLTLNGDANGYICSELIGLPEGRKLRGNSGYKMYDHPAFVTLAKKYEKTIEMTQARDPSIVAYQHFLNGKFDFLLYHYTYPWDHIAGIAMAQHMGGVAANWDAQPFSLAQGRQGLIVAKNQEILDFVQEKLGIPLRTALGTDSHPVGGNGHADHGDPKAAL